MAGARSLCADDREAKGDDDETAEITMMSCLKSKERVAVRVENERSGDLTAAQQRSAVQMSKWSR